MKKISSCSRWLSPSVVDVWRRGKVRQTWVQKRLWGLDSKVSWAWPASRSYHDPLSDHAAPFRSRTDATSRPAQQKLSRRLLGYIRRTIHTDPPPLNHQLFHILTLHSIKKKKKKKKKKKRKRKKKKKKPPTSINGSPSQRPCYHERRWQGNWWWKSLLHNLPCSPSSYSSTYVTPIPSLTISSNRLIHPLALFSAWILRLILLLFVGAFLTAFNNSPGRLVGVY